MLKLANDICRCVGSLCDIKERCARHTNMNNMNYSPVSDFRGWYEQGAKCSHYIEDTTVEVHKSSMA